MMISSNTCQPDISMTPELGNRLHWNNSSNVLCNYMKKQEYLDMIIKNKAIIPRYVLENIGYLNLKFKKICFPMTCFCDIPFSKVNSHMSRYGEYGIGLDKVAVLDKYRIQPIHYMNENSPLTEDFRIAFTTFSDVAEKTIDKDTEILYDYLLSTLVYMKPIWGQEKNNKGELENYVYQDECEWRFIPSQDFPKELCPIVLPQHKTTQKAADIYSEALKNYEKCWLKFEWNEIRYLIVPDEAAVNNTISTIEGLEIDNKEKKLLISKIEVSRRFSDNM